MEISGADEARRMSDLRVAGRHGAHLSPDDAAWHSSRGPYVEIHADPRKINTQYDSGSEPDERQQAAIDDYAKKKSPMPAITATVSPSGEVVTQDGNHRVMAARKRGDTTIAVHIPKEHLSRLRNTAMETSNAVKYIRSMKDLAGVGAPPLSESAAIRTLMAMSECLSVEKKGEWTYTYGSGVVGLSHPEIGHAVFKDGKRVCVGRIREPIIPDEDDSRKHAAVILAKAREAGIPDAVKHLLPEKVSEAAPGGVENGPGDPVLQGTGSDQTINPGGPTNPPEGASMAAKIVRRLSLMKQQQVPSMAQTVANSLNIVRDNEAPVMSTADPGAGALQMAIDQK